MKKTEEMFTYEEVKDYCSNIKELFENLELSEISEEDLKKINTLKDAWVNYEFKYISLSYLGDERPEKTCELFIISNSIENKNIKEKLLEYAYNHIDNMRYEDIFFGGEFDKINNLLVSKGLLDIDSYISYLDQVKSLKMILNK